MRECSTTTFNDCGNSLTRSVAAVCSLPVQRVLLVVYFPSTSAALPQKSPGQIFSVQPLCSLCLGGKNSQQNQPQSHREHRCCTQKAVRTRLLGQSPPVPQIQSLNRTLRKRGAKIVCNNMRNLLAHLLVARQRIAIC